MKEKEHQALTETEHEEPPSTLSRIHYFWEPTIFGLSFNSYMELFYVLFRAVPGLGKNLNIPFLAYSFIVPPLAALLKLLERYTGWNFLKKINAFLQGLDTFPASLIFILQIFGAFGQLIASQLNDNEFTEVDVPDGAIAALVLTFSGFSALLTVASLGYYERWARRYADNKPKLSKLFDISNKFSSFAGTSITLNAFGRMVIEFLNIFEIAGTKEEENPRKWFVNQILPTLIGAIFIGALITYIAHREKPIKHLGNKHQRLKKLEIGLDGGKVLIINGNYWALVYELLKHPEETRSDRTLVHISGMMTLLLVALPFIYSFRLFIYLFESAATSIKNYYYPPVSNDKSDLIHQDVKSLTEPFIKSTEEIIEAAQEFNDVENLRHAQQTSYFSNISMPSFKLPNWLSFLSSSHPKPEVLAESSSTELEDITVATKIKI